MSRTTKLSLVEERLICELRSQVLLALDDITEVMRRCVRAGISRSAVHRCLVRHGLNKMPKPDKPQVGVFETAGVGFIHIDLKHLPALDRAKSYAFVAIDRATRFIHVEIVACRDGSTIAGCLERFLQAFPHTVHTVLTDNGSEFTDRFAADVKDKPEDKPSGRHPFDRACAARQIRHRLIKPIHPQTNGVVERFNRRLAEAIRSAPAVTRNRGNNRFESHADRDAFIHGFVHAYNRIRLKCLGHKAPLQALTNLPEPNTPSTLGSPDISRRLSVVYDNVQ
jgi:hypothetical protein